MAVLVCGAIYLTSHKLQLKERKAIAKSLLTRTVNTYTVLEFSQDCMEVVCLFLVALFFILKAKRVVVSKEGESSDTLEHCRISWKCLKFNN